ncbi:response regulator [Fibrobacteria bacterium R8-3-H12]
MCIRDKGYVSKTKSADIIIEAINTVLDNKIYLSENERERLFTFLEENAGKDKKDWTAYMQTLSNRELQVFLLISKGYGTVEIASMLKLSAKTIDTHKEHMKAKLHCNTTKKLRQHAIEWANHHEL